MEILSDFQFPRQFWAVGSSYHGTKDETENFVANGNWIDGWWELLKDERNKNKLSQIQTGDILVMKSSATKGPKHSITFTKVKAIGTVIGKVNGYTFSVKWFERKRNKFPKDFDGIRYGRTIQSLREDDLLKFVKEFVESQ